MRTGTWAPFPVDTVGRYPTEKQHSLQYQQGEREAASTTLNGMASPSKPQEPWRKLGLRFFV